MAEGRGLHQFQVLLVLGSRTAGHLVDPFADVFVAEVEHPFEEDGEELIVTAESRCRNEAAEGQRIDEAVIEILLLLCQHSVEIFRWNQRRSAGWLGKRGFPGVDAERVLAGILNKGLGIYGTAQVDMQVGALGK